MKVDGPLDWSSKQLTSRPAVPDQKRRVLLPWLILCVGSLMLGLFAFEYYTAADGSEDVGLGIAAGIGLILIGLSSLLGHDRSVQDWHWYALLATFFVSFTHPSELTGWRETWEILTDSLFLRRAYRSCISLHCDSGSSHRGDYGDRSH